MKKIFIISGAVIIVVALVLINIFKQEKGVVVETEKIDRGTIMQKVTGSGQIRPEVQVKVSARVAGKILRLHAEEGDQVKKGQLLVELDQEQYRAALERAESTLLSMRANEKKLNSELIRSKNLYNQGLMSNADLEAVQASFDAAESNTRQAQASVKEAEDALEKTRLHADMNGTVSQLNKEEGEIALGAQFQEDVIMIVADLTRMEAAIEIDENDVVDVSEGDTAKVEIDAFIDTTFKGIVTKIANSATVKGLGTQEQVTNFEVTVALLDYNEKFRPGMSTTVDIITDTKYDVLKVPIQAVTVRPKDKLEKKPGVEEPADDELSSRGEGQDIQKQDMIEVVFCVEKDRAVSKPVNLDISDDTHYAVLSGLEEGETVITGPFRVLSRTLNNGDLIEIEKKEEEIENAD